MKTKVGGAGAIGMEVVRNGQIAGRLVYEDKDDILLHMKLLI